mmetsp:Transcript_136717/g.381009  ORF Transcript_136717/g.381009 Transcript_136717/m.381009 type:complete len:683 (+) Transcript_136717:55-2103(+)
MQGPGMAGAGAEMPRLLQLNSHGSSGEITPSKANHDAVSAIKLHPADLDEVISPASLDFQEADAEACAGMGETPEPSARPQRLESNGKSRDLWPEHWGVTVEQVQYLIKRCRSDPRWKRNNTMRELVSQYVKPLTAGTGVGYALLVNREHPKEVTIMISHSWNENAEEFLESLERTIHKDDVMFICALSLFQNEDGSGPNIAEQLGSAAEESPFYRVLQRIRDRNQSMEWGRRWFPYLSALPSLMLSAALLAFAVPVIFDHCIPSFEYCYCPMHDHEAIDGLENSTLLHMYHTIPIGLRRAYRPFPQLAVAFASCMALAFFTLRRTHVRPGCLVAVPNRQDDLYTRLWCVYEVFVATTLGVPVTLANTFAFAGTCSCQKASCSSETDKANIRAEIEEWGRQKYGNGSLAYDAVDRKIARVTRHGHWTTFFVMMRAMTPLALLCMMTTQLEMEQNASGVLMLANMAGTKLGWAFLVLVVFFAVQGAQGHPSSVRLGLAVAMLLFVCGLYSLTEECTLTDAAHHPGLMFMKKFGFAPLIGCQYISAYLICSVCGTYLRFSTAATRSLKCVAMILLTANHMWRDIRGTGVPVIMDCDLLPWVIFVLIRLSYYCGILIFGSWAAARWGVSIGVDFNCRSWCKPSDSTALRSFSSFRSFRSSASLGQAPSARLQRRQPQQPQQPQQH